MMIDTLYYDGQCPLCRTEMEKLGRLADASLELVDIHETDMDAETRLTMLRVLHLRTASGEVLQGLDANVAAWQHTRWGLLFRWMRWPLVGWFADRVYAVWADRRFRRLYGTGCEVCNLE